MYVCMYIYIYIYIYIDPHLVALIIEAGSFGAWCFQISKVEQVLGAQCYKTMEKPR